MVSTGAPAASTTATTACASRASRHRRWRCARRAAGPSRTAARPRFGDMETGMAAGALDVRQPAVSGRFYPARADELRAEVVKFLGGAANAGGKPHVGVVAPHAGYVYSGPIAGKVFADTVVPRRVIVMAPNHTGRGARAAVWARGA